MTYTPLSDEKNVHIHIPDGTDHSSTNSQLSRINSTRTKVLILTSIQFTISLLISIFFAFTYAFNYSIGLESYHPIIRFLPLLSSVCFLIGMVIADRYHVKGLLIFSKLIMLNIIIVCGTLLIFVIVPTAMKKYTTSIASTIIFVMGYQWAVCFIAFLPAYTIRMTNQLSTLITENQFHK